MIFEVLQDPRFVQAYQLYQRGNEELVSISITAGLKTLDAALAIDPQFTAALNAYGGASVFSGQHLRLAESRLHQAIRLNPQYALAWLNLARLYARTGRRDLAKATFDQALKLSREVMEYDYLEPIIRTERAGYGV